MNTKTHSRLSKWTDQDMTDVYEAVIAKRATDKTTKLIDLIIEAQKKIVPPSRHKTILGFSHVDALLKRLKPQLPELHDWKPYKRPSHPKSRIAEPTFSPPPSPDAKTADNGTTHPVPVEDDRVMVINLVAPEKVTPTPLDAASQLSTGQLVGIVVDRLIRTLSAPPPVVPAPLLDAAALQALVQSVFKVPAPVATPPRAVPQKSDISITKDRPQSVLVIGLRNDDYRHFREKAPPGCEYIFVDKDNERNLPTADIALVNRHSSHGVWDRAKKVVNKVHFVTGGVSKMVQYVRDMDSRHELAPVSVPV